MSHACCTFVKPNNEPCAARPLPDSDFCLFHDPAHQETLAAGRSKGGAAPRRLRHYPRLLDHLHVAELLGELFIEALNDPEAIDTKRLQALTNLARVLLKAVGVPKDAEPVQSHHREPTAAEDCLLRLYPPLAPELEALLAAEPLTDPDFGPSNAPTPERPNAERLPHAEQNHVQADEQVVNKAPTGAPASRDLLTTPPMATCPASAASRRLPADPSPLIPPIQPSLKAGPHLNSDSQHPGAQQEPEQDGNRSRTGLPGMRTSPVLLFAVQPPQPGAPAVLPLATPIDELAPPAPYPLSFRLPIAHCSPRAGDNQAAYPIPLATPVPRDPQGSSPPGSVP